MLRIASVPSGHPYVQHLDHPDVPGVVRLGDPPVAGAPDGRWWPHPSLTPEWLREHVGEYDLLHVHFGFEHRTPEELVELVATLRELNRPLVLTVHDLRSPHSVDQTHHEAQLDVLVPAADALITLTPGAAREIARRWDREALVVPHPHLAPPEFLARERRPSAGFSVGLHLKSLRATTRALPVVRGLAAAIDPLPEARLTVTVHREALEPAFVRHDAELYGWLREAADVGRLELDVIERYDDPQLFAYLLGLDLSVLPYGDGTHSGWLELCHDLGTPVLAPDTGHWHEQQLCHRYASGPDGPDAAGLAAAVQHAYEQRDLPWPRPTPQVRDRQRAAVARIHRDVYLEVMSRVVAA